MKPSGNRWRTRGHKFSLHSMISKQRVLTIGGAVTVLVLAGGLAVLWRAELHRKKKSVSAGAVVAH